MDCPNCGKHNSDDSPLCSSCGWVLCWDSPSKEAGRRSSLVFAIGLVLFVILLFPILVVVTTSERGSRTETVSISQESMDPYQSIYDVDRKAMGFPPLPSEGTVKVKIIDRENWSYEYDPPNYDVMLQFYEIGLKSYKYTSRTVALKKKNGHLQWVHEQMMFHGPKKYTDDESLPNQEWIVLRCETEQIGQLGKDTVGTEVMYSGPDERLIGEKGWTIDGGDLSLEDVIPVLREWGYEYEVAGFETQGLPKKSEDE